LASVAAVSVVVAAAGFVGFAAGLVCACIVRLQPKANKRANKIGKIGLIFFYNNVL
jgi:hypothetical protein